MRIFAALWVVLYHYWPRLMEGGLPRFVEKGYLGVELFFVLSGFILCHVYLQSFGERTFSYKSFLWARLARIYPVHLAVLLGLVGLVGLAAMLGIAAGENIAAWSSLPAQVLLLQAWGLAPEGGWNHPSWSISAEWFAYLTFPITAAIVWPLRNRAVLAVSLAVSLVWVANIVFPLWTGTQLTAATIAWGALRIVPCFLLGSAVYLLWRAHPTRSRDWSIAITVTATMAAAAATTLRAPDALTVSVFGALIFGLASLTTSGSRWLTSPVGVYLGEVSFSVYMICIPYELLFVEGARKVLHLPDGPLPWPLWGVLFAGVIPAAMVLHHLVERPARDAMRRWEQRGFRVGSPRRNMPGAPSQKVVGS